MLTKYKDVRPKKGMKSPLKNVFLPAAHSDFFPIENKKRFEVGPGAYSPGKFLEIYIL